MIPKNVTSDRPIAFMPTLIRWWEALRAPEVAKWQLKYRVEEEGQGALALVLDLAKAFERVSLSVFGSGQRTSVS